MSYFRWVSPSKHCAHQSEWEAVLGQLRSKEWIRKYSDYQCPLPSQVSHYLEAKALHVFTIARRLVRAAYRLAKAVREEVEGTGCILDDGEEWKLIFVETTSLLFPMLELVGHARLGVSRAKAACPKRNFFNAPNLWAGLYWLQEPKALPQVPNPPETDGTKMSVVLGLEIGHLILLRHYFLHGSQTWDDARAYIPDVMNYELPRAIAKQTEEVIPDYWRQLKQDDGTQEWIERLADAGLRPLKMKGSGDFEAGLVDPDIVDYLEGRVDIWGNVRA